MTIIELYRALKNDSRLQKNWELNQPRIDRAFESPLIARTPREVATAALLFIKMQCLPNRREFIEIDADDTLIGFARTQGAGGARLANVIEGKTPSDASGRAAAIHAITFYQDRTAPNPLVKASWPESALEALRQAEPLALIHPALRPTWAERKAGAVIAIAKLLQDSKEERGGHISLRMNLRAIPGLGPERADAAGTFGFHQSWPITDDYLWRLLVRHAVIDPQEAEIKTYDRRRQSFEPHWQSLLAEAGEEPHDLAATLYLWADEAERFGFTYG